MKSKRIICLLFFLLLGLGCGKRDDSVQASSDADPLPAPTFAGLAACADCHAAEVADWSGSHHDLAMQHATGDAVVGDFDDAEYEIFGVTSRFFKSDDEYWIETENAVGDLEEFRVAYTFGIEPLQQYLVEMDRGRIQALSIAWDTVDRRWFHLYPDEKIGHDDYLHWTGREQNWNYMCAECHSTNLQKNYTLNTDTFATTWGEINVSCEACHGPASNHVALAEKGFVDEAADWLLDLDDLAGAVWQMNSETGIAERVPTLMAPPAQPEACGRCHARRGIATPDYEYGRPLTDTHTVALLDDRLYFADGQIREEVYVYGSFVQSKMYRAGVTCTDCHEPHKAGLRASGKVSNVCSTCHLASRFDAKSHHGHNESAVECVDCHMTSRDFMIVDGRRDHSFRVPRPDLTPLTGAPNACNQCHAEQTADWAAAALVEWNGEPDPKHYSLAIHAGRTGSAGANDALFRVTSDSGNPGIVRATAWSLLAAPLTPAQMEALRDALSDPDQMVRIGALRALRAMPPEAQASWGAPLLGDRIRSVRLAAADLLSPIRQALPAAYVAVFDAAESEYIRSQVAIAERPEAIGNLANLFRERGEFEQAESYYLYALTQQPDLTVARSNLADLYREQSRDDEAEELLRDGLLRNGEDAALRHSLGLLLVRKQLADEALAELRSAAELQPDNSRFVYVYGVALNSLGHADEAIAVLEEAITRFPNDVEIGLAHVSFLIDRGRRDAAREAVRRLQQSFPEHPQVNAAARSLLTD